MNLQTLHIYEFGPFRLDVSERFLLRDSEAVALTPKVFDTLLTLVERNGHVVSKDELMQRLWPDSFVEESSLSQNIFLLRRALGEATSSHQYIETIPKRGYRFVADVREVRGSDAEIVFQQRTNTQILIEEKDASQEMGVPIGAATSALPAPSPSGNRKRKLYALFACAALIAAAGFGYVWRLRAGGKGEASLKTRSIAVLPFKTLGAGGESELLGLGMADALIIRLSHLKEPAILSTSSVFRYATDETNTLDAGRELGVDAVLEGTVQRSGERVRVTARLISLNDGGTLWAGKFDEQSSNIFALQDSISKQLAEALTPQLGGDERGRMEKQYTGDTEAYQAYLTGLYFLNKRSKEGIAKAIEYFRQATERDPSYALAYAGLADCYNLSLFNDYNIVPPQEAREKRLEAARKALALDDTLAEAHMAMAAVESGRGDSNKAEREYLRALELNPSHAMTRVRYAYCLADKNRLDEALQQMRRGQELDPVSPTTNGALAHMLLQGRRYDESAKYAQRALELNPEFIEARVTLGEAYLEKGMYDEAVAEFRKMGDDRRTWSLQLLVIAYARSGRRAEAMEVFSELQRTPDGGRLHPYNLAVIYGSLGEMDKAFKSLEETSLPPTVKAMIRNSPMLDPLRADPRFKDYLRRRNLENPAR
ncbi:MAG: winged helix-turn-helix domain-containing protein [Rubrivivax sp.]|nr:winged helix-turn-helix domain-containing protein [Pyrinomonadaceae bacterium]